MRERSRRRVLLRFQKERTWNNFTARPSSPCAAASKVALGGDGQVTLGNIVMKGGANKVRRIYGGKVLVGFAGGTADAFSLLDRFEAQAGKAPGQPDARRRRTGEGLAHRPHAAPPGSHADRGRRDTTLVITGNGDVLDPEDGICAIGSGGAYAQAAAQGARRKTPNCRRATSSKSR